MSAASPGAKALSYRYRVIRQRYAWCARPGADVDVALSPELGAERRAMMQALEEYTGGWGATARRVLRAHPPASITLKLRSRYGGVFRVIMLSPFFRVFMCKITSFSYLSPKFKDLRLLTLIRFEQRARRTAGCGT